MLDCGLTHIDLSLATHTDRNCLTSKRNTYNPTSVSLAVLDVIYWLTCQFLSSAGPFIFVKAVCCLMVLFASAADGIPPGPHMLQTSTA